MVMQLHPKSRGAVTLRSKDPRDPPVIEGHFLDAPEDVLELRQAVKKGREVIAQAAFDPYRGKEVSPSDDVQTDEQNDDFVRQNAKSTRHPSCTCRMGIDEETSVVDGEGRVHGIEGLRVIDASVMPNIAGAALNATTIMLAEKLADKVLGNPALEPLMAAAAEARAASVTR